MTLLLGDTWPAWHPTARRGTLEGDGETRDVLALMAPFQPSGVARAREAAATALTVRGPDVLELLDIRAENNRIAWIHAGFDGIALSRLPEDHRVGPRAATELLLRVARVMAAHEEHPGAEADDVLVDLLGDVRVAGFARPFPTSPAYRAPGAGDREAVVAYRLGVLFAELLGAPVQAGGDPDSHEAAVRRAWIGAMAASGAALTERHGDWLRTLLAFHPDDRPPLSRIVAGLAELAEGSSGPSWAEACGKHYQRWLTAAFGDDPDETTLPHEWDADDLGPADATVEAVTLRRPLDEPILGDLSAEDDPTVDSELGQAPRLPNTPPAVERGSIPVAVGPPPEEAAKRPTLPLDLFEETVPGAPSDATTVIRNPEGAGAEPPWLRVAAVVLVGLAVGLIVWLLFG